VKLQLVVVLALVLPSAPGQGPRGPVHKPSAEQTWDPVTHDLHRIVVKFAEGVPVRLRGGRFVGRGDLDAANVWLGAARTARRVFQRPEATLDAEREALRRRLAADVEPPADLNQYFHLEFADAATGLRALRALNALGCVETAFPEHSSAVPCEPGDILPPTPLLDATQNYRDPAPTGIDQLRSRTIPGGRGEGLQVIDIESSWRMNHEDIWQLVPANVIGPHTESLNPNHGVAVIGELNADWDQWGVSGCVDRAAVKVHSHMRQFWASSVNVAAANSRPGDFIVLEVQLTDPQGRLVPMEYRQDVFDAVRAATMSGIHVVAAAGNGGNNLDDPVFLGLFDRSLRDSGSVIVGATEGSQLVRASFSNHGSRVDANGWGRNVTTCGYGDLFNPGGDVRQQYTAVFSGTSSATPIVTSAAMAVAGAVLEQQGTMILPGPLRTLLQQHGTPVPGGQIGRRPDLALLLQAVGLPSGLRIVQDAGIGGAIQFEVTGAPGGLYFVAVAFGRGRQVVPGLGVLLLDPASLFTVWSGMLSGAGAAGHAVPVPNQVALRGTDLFLQAFRTPGGSGAALTNSVQNHVP
jgi:serine protease